MQEPCMLACMPITHQPTLKKKKHTTTTTAIYYYMMLGDYNTTSTNIYYILTLVLLYSIQHNNNILYIYIYNNKAQKKIKFIYVTRQERRGENNRGGTMDDGPRTQSPEHDEAQQELLPEQLRVQYIYL